MNGSRFGGTGQGGLRRDWDGDRDGERARELRAAALPPARGTSGSAGAGGGVAQGPPDGGASSVGAGAGAAADSPWGQGKARPQISQSVPISAQGTPSACDSTHRVPSPAWAGAVLLVGAANASSMPRGVAGTPARRNLRSDHGALQSARREMSAHPPPGRCAKPRSVPTMLLRPTLPEPRTRVRPVPQASPCCDLDGSFLSNTESFSRRTHA
jgi:hypothetical protein